MQKIQNYKTNLELKLAVRRLYLVALYPVLPAIQVRRRRDHESTSQLRRLGHPMMNPSFWKSRKIIVHIQNVNFDLDDLEVLEGFDGDIKLDGAFV